MKLRFCSVALAALFLPSIALAGPPFLTDDPEPTDTGHWEIYGPLIEAEGKGASYEGAVAAEFNYGATPDLQLTVEIPLAYAHDANVLERGFGNIAVSAKYRFFHDEKNGLSIAAFPGITLPTATNGFGGGKVTALLPVWLQKDSGPWSVFGGGGYAINPGVDNRNFWTGAIAVSRQLTPKLLMGIEAERQGADVVGGSGSTSLGIGTIYQLKAPFRVLASGGPTLVDDGGAPGFHAFVALGTDF